jgi:hypothetical protein
MALAGAFGVAQYLKIVPDFPPALKPILYSAADVFVSPVDNIQETFGISVLEAMACGLPVVAADWSGYRDLVCDGRTGFLVPSIWSDEAGKVTSQLGMLMPYTSAEEFLAHRTALDTKVLFHSVDQLVTNRELALMFGESGRRRAIEQFSWQTVLKSFRSLWDEQYLEVIGACDEESTTAIRGMNWNELFSGYATSRLRDDWHVTVGKDLTAEITALRQRTELDLSRDACRDSPQLVRDLSSRVPGGYNTVMVALKKGYIELCDGQVPRSRLTATTR